MAAKPPAVYLTHYAQVRDVQKHGETLLRQTDQFAEIALRHQLAGEERASLIRQDLQALLMGQLSTHGAAISREQALEVLDLDLRLNSDGLVCWLDSLK